MLDSRSPVESAAQRSCGASRPRGLARWAVRRPWRILLSALAIGVLLPLAAASGHGRLSEGGYIAQGTPAARADQLLKERFGAGIPDVVLYVRAGAPATDPSVSRAGRAFTAWAERQPGVSRAVSYWTVGDPRLLSRDGRAALVTIGLRGDENRTAHEAGLLVPRLTGRHGPLRVSATGPAWVMAQTTELSRYELLQGEAIGVPLAVLVLLFAFGSLTAALLPAAIGGLSVVGTFAVLPLIARLTPISALASNMTTALGFGLAVDYALLVVTRYREELATGDADPVEAVVRTMRTVGRTIAVSAATMLLCLGALLLLPIGFLRSLAIAGITVVLLAGVCTAVVLPALLAIVGGRIERGDLFGFLRRRGRASGVLWWRRTAEAVTRRPVLAGGCAALLLGVLILPFAQVNLGVSDERVLPATVESHAVAIRIGHEFDLPWRRTIAVLLPHTDPVDQDLALDAYARRLSAVPGVREVASAGGSYRSGRQVGGPGIGSLVYTARGATWLEVVGSGRPDQDGRLVQELRVLPSPGGAPPLVAGSPARALDTKNALLGALPAVAALIVGSVLLLLFLFTGSVLIPVKAVLMGVISLGASFGAMVYVFQEGHLQWLLGHFTVTGELESSVPVLVFGAAFALSVDYEVFLISRIHEEYRACGDNHTAVVTGIARTGPVITAAASVMATALLPLVISQITLLKLIGLGLGLAVLMDATLVRGVLVPALMELTGRANWWAPTAFAPLHRHRGEPAPRRPVPSAVPSQPR